MPRVMGYALKTGNTNAFALLFEVRLMVSFHVVAPLRACGAENL